MSNGTDVKPTYTTDRTTERRVMAWIGKAVRVEGRVIGGEDLTIDGDVEGSIELGGHSLTIGQEANINANLLAIVRHLTEMHGGSVAAVSAGEGKGATFIVRLPTA